MRHRISGTLSPPNPTQAHRRGARATAGKASAIGRINSPANARPCGRISGAKRASRIQLQSRISVSQHRELTGAASIPQSGRASSLYASTALTDVPISMETTGAAACPAACSMAPVTVIRHADGTASPSRRSHGVASATASGCPRNSNVNTSPPSPNNPSPAGTANANVKPNAPAQARRACRAASAHSPAAVPVRRRRTAPDSTGTSDIATEADNEGSMLNTGTANVE